MTVLITLTTAGADTGPFNLFSDANEYTSAFAVGVSKLDLEAGYPSDLVPDGTTTIKITSINSLCSNSIYLPTGITTTTTTTNSSCSTCSVGDIMIGTQIWTGCNLDISTYRDGTPIPEVTDPTEWSSLTTGAWCYYDNNIENCTTYSKLYNWYAVNDPRGLAPIGYHIPSDAEWNTLTTYLGGESIAGGKMKSIGDTTIGDGLWLSPNAGADNSSGFTGLPASGRGFNGIFNGLASNGYWWSSIEYDSNNSEYINLNYLLFSSFYYHMEKTNGLSVRLIKD